MVHTSDFCRIQRLDGVNVIKLSPNSWIRQALRSDANMTSSIAADLAKLRIRLMLDARGNQSEFWVRKIDFEAICQHQK